MSGDPPSSATAVAVAAPPALDGSPVWLEEEAPDGLGISSAEPPLEALLTKLLDTEAYDADLEALLTEIHRSIVEFQGGTDCPFDASWYNHETLFGLLGELDRMTRHLKSTQERWTTAALEQDTRRIEMNAMWQEMVSYLPPSTCRSPTAFRGTSVGEGSGDVWSVYSDEFDLLSPELSRVATPLSGATIDLPRGPCRPFGQRWWNEAENSFKAEVFLHLLIPHFSGTVDMLRMWLPLCEPCSASHLPDRIKAEMEELIDVRWNYVRLKCTLTTSSTRGGADAASDFAPLESARSGASAVESSRSAKVGLPMEAAAAAQGSVAPSASATTTTSVRLRHTAPFPARPVHCMDPYMRRAYLQAQANSANRHLQRHAPDLYESLTRGEAELAAAQQAEATRSIQALDARVAYIAMLFDMLEKLGVALQRVSAAITQVAQYRVVDLLQDLLVLGNRADRVLRSTSRMWLEWSPEGIRLLSGAGASPKAYAVRKPTSSIEPLQTETILLLRATCRRGLAPECARLLMEFRDMSASYAALLLTAIDSELSPPTSF